MALGAPVSHVVALSPEDDIGRRSSTLRVVESGPSYVL